MATEPLKITAHLLDGRVNSSDGYFFLHSILYHAWFLKYDPDVMLGLKKGKPKHYGLPLLQLENNQYASSMGFYKQLDQRIEHWHKKPDWDKQQDHLQLDKGKIKESVGAERAYRMPQVIRTISDMEFYCVGTKEKIIDLLSYMPAIGKKPSAGWGRVARWSVESIETDYSASHPDCGITKPISIEEDIPDAGEYRIGDIAIRPPAWKHTNQKTCYIPKVITNEEP